MEARSRIHVTVGMPVYNGEATLRKALDSVVRQTYPYLEIIVSDNASTDATESICREYASIDTRIRYVRQISNVGAAKNFRFLIDEARSPFFMWAACDDTRSEDFVEANLDFLLSHPDHVASCSPVRFEGEDFDPIRMGDGTLDGEVASRILALFANPIHANGRFYSLVRRDALAGCPVLGKHFLAADWAIVAHLAAQGRLQRCDRGWTMLGKGGISGSRHIFRAHRNSWVDFWLPFRTLASFAWRLSADFHILDRVRLALGLLKLNLLGFYAQLLATRRPR